MARLWPSVVALSLVFLLRSVLAGLLGGAFSGAILLANGNPLLAFIAFFRAHLIPSLQSSWNASILVFTLLMGGFVALIEHGGGISGLLRRFVRDRGAVKGRIQWAAFGLGLVCFFDGLANSMLVGRVMRPLADRVGLSRAKLAYVVDSTSAPVACVALISTWIAYQLAMIQEGLSHVGVEGNPYLLFLRSIPVNFYCLFTLLLVALTILTGFNLGPMRRAEAEAEAARGDGPLFEDDPRGGHWARAAIPLVALILALLVGMYVSGTDAVLPIRFSRIMDAFGSADAALVLVCASAFACMVAGLINVRPRETPRTGDVFLEGMTTLFVPMLILVSAWCLSSTLKELGAAAALTRLLSGTLRPSLIPAAVFLVGTMVSFCTGTSWGTMGVLMPLAVPLAVSLAAGLAPDVADTILVGTIAAVFSGAVFGDHCSPMSDTTIVSAIASGVDPIDHVQTQLPYALVAAAVALAAGFLPYGLGLPFWGSWLIGGGVLAILTRPRNRG